MQIAGELVSQSIRLAQFHSVQILTDFDRLESHFSNRCTVVCWPVVLAAQLSLSNILLLNLKLHFLCHWALCALSGFHTIAIIQFLYTEILWQVLKFLESKKVLCQWCIAAPSRFLGWSEWTLQIFTCFCLIQNTKFPVSTLSFFGLFRSRRLILIY